MNTLFRLCALGLAVLSLSACGWHLRGSDAPGRSGETAAVEPLEIELYAEDVEPQLLSLLRRQMKQRRIFEGEDSTLRISLGRTQWRSSRLRANAAGDAQSELLVLRQPLFIGGGETILADEVLEVRRDIQVDPAAMAASEQARRWARNQMRQEMADRVLRRIEALLRTTP